MAISIKDPETDRLARALAEATGVSLTEAIREAIREALRERLARETSRAKRSVAAAVAPIQERIARLPILDPRSPDEIIGFDSHGAPGH